MPTDSPSRRGSATPSDSGLVLTGVFCTFAPIGLLMLMVFQQPWNWVAAVAGATLSGLIAVCWAATFIYRRFWWLAVIVPLQAVGPMYLFRGLAAAGWIWGTPPESAQYFRAALGITSISGIVAGYVLMLRFVRRQERRAERARAELDVAQQIHASLVPPIELRIGDIAVLASSIASSEMGGDLVDAVARDAEVDVLLADVSGHGVGAGIVMSMLKSSSRTLLRSRPSLESFLGELNRVVSELARPGMFATIACARVRPGGETEYALAGHLPIFHFVAKSGEVRELPNQCLPLGVEAEETFLAGSTHLAPGDCLILLTDGLVEVQNRHGEQLGLAGLLAAIRDSSGAAQRELSAALFRAAESHGPRLDDQSVLIVRRTS